MPPKAPSVVTGASIPGTSAANPAPTRSVSAKPNTEVSVETRKIDNGYITREGSYDRDTGAYSSKEVYSEKPPKIEVSE